MASIKLANRFCLQKFAFAKWLHNATNIEMYVWNQPVAGFESFDKIMVCNEQTMDRGEQIKVQLKWMLAMFRWNARHFCQHFLGLKFDDAKAHTIFFHGKLFNESA